MCRSADIQGFYFNNHKDRLKAKSFFVRLSRLLATQEKKMLPEFLTLVYLPRINETALEISGKDIRPDTPAFVTLYRVVTAKTDDGEVIYGSREPVVVTDAVSFEVYFDEEKVLKGIFRKDEADWRLKCKCVLDREIGDVNGAVAEVYVGLDGHAAIIERVVLKSKRRNNHHYINSHRRMTFDLELEEIPEERGVESEPESDGCCSCSCSCSCGSDVDVQDEEAIHLELDGVRWAVDVGIWVMCLGVGYLVSKASAKSLRRKSLF
ncbi:hypothetical protein WN944_012782 [Citrus x changshan-huyou]|uniref:Uncharacterized protein n=1 Tax=Citrus x changshan-huyou TaxID=2935761 RepID=A0AAP0QJV9_9ROSI